MKIDMKKRHKDLARRIVSLMQCEPDYESINEIRIINDGGGTGTWGVVIKEARKDPQACAVSMYMPEAQAEAIPLHTYWDKEDFDE